MKTSFVCFVLALLIAAAAASTPECRFEGHVLTNSGNDAGNNGGSANYDIDGLTYSLFHPGPGTSGSPWRWIYQTVAVDFKVDYATGKMWLRKDIVIPIPPSGANTNLYPQGFVFKFKAGNPTTGAGVMSFDPNADINRDHKDLNLQSSADKYHYIGGNLPFVIVDNAGVHPDFHSFMYFAPEQQMTTDTNAISFRGVSGAAGHTSTVALWGTEPTYQNGGSNTWKAFVSSNNNKPTAVDLVFSGQEICDDDTTPEGEDDPLCPDILTESAVWRLRNHPDGAAGGDYGLRFDKLVEGQSPLTFDFDTQGAKVVMGVSVVGGQIDTLRIKGRAMDNELGHWWLIDYTVRHLDPRGNPISSYRVGQDGQGSAGTITREDDPSITFNFVDKDDGSYSFWLMKGHRCPGDKVGPGAAEQCGGDTWTGHGWVEVDPMPSSRYTRDWLFVVGECVPGDDPSNPSGEEECLENCDGPCTEFHVVDNCKHVAEDAVHSDDTCVTLCFDATGQPAPCASTMHGSD